MMRSLFLICLLVMGASASGYPVVSEPLRPVAFVQDDTRDPEALADDALEAKAKAIMLGIRCLVCQNQSIIDSNADLAKDLRMLVRAQVQAGKTKAEIETFLVKRYGDWVLLNPPLDLRTIMLWASPVLLLLLGLSLLLLRARHGTETDRQTKNAPPPLSAEEQNRLETLLAEAGDSESRKDHSSS